MIHLVGPAVVHIVQIEGSIPSEKCKGWLHWTLSFICLMKFPILYLGMKSAYKVQDWTYIARC